MSKDKEKSQQDGKGCERIKPHALQRCLEGSNKPCAHQDPETEPELCLSVSCRGTGQQWPAAGAGALGAVDQVVALALLEEVAINPKIELPELTQDWGNRLFEGTNKTLCTPGPRRKEK